MAAPAGRHRRRRRRGPRGALRQGPRAQRWAGRRSAAPAPLRRVPARAQQCRHEPDQGRTGGRGAALRGVPAHPGPDLRVRVSDGRGSGTHRRGRRRVAGQPRGRRLGRGGPRPRDRCGPARGLRPAGQGVEQRRGVHRAHRGPAGRERGGCRGRRARADGLQAGGRADVGPMEDQARGHAPPGPRGPRPRSGDQRGRRVRDVRVDPPRAEQDC